MQQEQFNLITVLQHAARWHGAREVVTNSVEGGIHRITYSDLHKRTLKLANALTQLGVNPGDRVGTMAWNTWRHLECWYAISGFGAVCHTLNPRLSDDQKEFIINHANDRFIFVDSTFLPVITSVLDRLPCVEALIIMTDKAHMPDTSDVSVDVHCYEDLILEQDEEFDWPSFDENVPSSLCYTSGTTGDPKGVLYTHRSNILHAMAASGANLFGLKTADAMLMIVPMFHANSWGLAFAVPMTGSKMVMPGPHMDGVSLHSIITSESVTTAAAVPTIWTGLLDHLDKENLSVPTLKETVIGGSAVPRSMIERFSNQYDVDVIQAWGMTETSPIGTCNRPLPFMDSLSDEEKITYTLKQGRAPYGIDMKIVDESGDALPHDGIAFGRLLVRGHWVVDSYYLSETTALDNDGWFDTGDVATIDEHGFMQITDRAKDVIKSGGEWISSVEIENTAIGHPDVQIAACIGVAHPKWEERPLLVVVKKPDANPSKESILEFVGKDCAKWQIPDDVIFIDDMPLTATGKIDKKPLRASYYSYLTS